MFSRGWTCRAIMLGGLAALMFVALGAQSAWAEASTHCVKATKVGKKYTGGFVDKNCTAPSAKHEGRYEFIKASSLSEPEQEELKALLKYVKVVPSGVASKPTVQVSGANVQIVSGSGSTAGAVNGEGNLVIGYDEKPTTPQTGSHNLILGEEQSFTSYGGILAGRLNTISAPFASVTGGSGNTASASAASVSGGGVNTASAFESSVSGGASNTASVREASVSGGFENKASAELASVSGGRKNSASGIFASASGGEGNSAAGEYTWVAGGSLNHAGARLSSVVGAKGLNVIGENYGCGGYPELFVGEKGIAC